jgi:hypothetical protein
MSNSSDHEPSKIYLPREHGATAMLLTTIVCAAILARRWHWAELATLIAAFSALALKDPAVVLFRQWFVWKQPNAETPNAARWCALWSLLLASSGLDLLFTWPFHATLALGLGVALFSALAVFVNVRNRQRSTLFQIISAAALTSTSLATALSATAEVPRWCWLLWPLLAMQAAAGILVVHARLDAIIAARIAMRNADSSPSLRFRRAAYLALAVLVLAAIAAVVTGSSWGGFTVTGSLSVAAALLIAAIGYAYDLNAQKNPAALQLPLIKVGQRALMLSSIYAVLLMIGLWQVP